MNIVPARRQRRLSAASWLLANAIGKSSSMPITSPVERISGPRMMSTPGNLLNGKTLSLTEKCFGTTSLVHAQFVERLAGHDQRGEPAPAARRSPSRRTAPCGWPAG